jgi:hypothetical protein
MAEQIPETPTQAARALIGWFAGALAFKCVESFDPASPTAFAPIGYGIGAIIVAIADFKLKDLLAGSPRLVKTLNCVASDARWWSAIALTSLVVISLSPFVEEKRWHSQHGSLRFQLLRALSLTSWLGHCLSRTTTRTL